MKFTYSCLIAVIAMSSVSPFAQAKITETLITFKPTSVEVQCNDMGWTGGGYYTFGWRTYCSTLSVRKYGTITDKINVKDNCDASRTVALYKLTNDQAPKFQFEACVKSINSSNPYSQSR